MSDMPLDIVLRLGEIGAILGGGGMVAYRLGRATFRFESALTIQQADILELKTDIKQLNKVITNVAVATQRMDSLSDRLNMIDRRVDEMKHWKGFIDAPPDGKYTRDRK